MKYFKEFEIRWSDLDANRHLANSTYLEYMAHTRLSFLVELGFSHQLMQERQFGPVVFHEHMYYFKEILPGPPVKVSFEIKGLSKDGMFFEFHHNVYSQDGIHLAHCELMGGWISLKTRKLIPLMPDLLVYFEKVEKPEDFKWLTREDTRKFAKRPQNLE